MAFCRALYSYIKQIKMGYFRINFLYCTNKSHCIDNFLRCIGEGTIQSLLKFGFRAPFRGWEK